MVDRIISKNVVARKYKYRSVRATDWEQVAPLLMDRRFRYRLVIILINYSHELVLGQIHFNLEWWKMHVNVTELEDTAKAHKSCSGL